MSGPSTSSDDIRDDEIIQASIYGTNDDGGSADDIDLGCENDG